ncbi:hypothetical protein VPNG_05833 [Cytospora leucostoma]|uniref:FAD-binding PCMH-type domain-containing protein n=1 Tax=Cytospora leucostoma TaxID=1230097 RepID=A0A423X0E6_9PEZI|nr:hypothetical protein VPNG_05833 [Cytospora leucostoma]
MSICRMLLATVASAAIACGKGVAENDIPTAASNISLAPAVTQVADTAGLSQAESLQLTDQVLGNVDSQLVAAGLGNISSIFDFGNNNTAVTKRSSSQCKTYAGDSSWPSDTVWQAFDSLLGNALLQAPPLASPCYTNWDNYDSDLCTNITNNWHTDSWIHSDHPSSIMSPFYEGSTCMPTADEFSNCTLGGYPYYIVNATNVAQVQLAVNFARNLNLRLVVKNTGHDFSGKSAGEGALSIWTHNLQDAEFIENWTRSKSYNGKAIKIGSGVQSLQAYQFAHKYDVTIVGGEGESVGIAGGYIQGGGHSPMAGFYGLSSDSVVEVDVVTADGKFLTCSDDQNADLFWALRGGGGGTFGVVTSVTVKAWPKIGVSASNFSITSGGDTGISTDTFWDAVHALFKHFPSLADAGSYSYLRWYPLSTDVYYFSMTPFWTPNKTVDEHVALLQPWLDDLAALNITLDFNATYYDNFYDAWAEVFPLEGVGYDAGRIASRLFPRANWENATLLDETWSAIKNTTENNFFFTGFNFENKLHPDNTANSANPAWRDSLVHGLSATFWEDGDDLSTIFEVSNSLTYGCMDQWRAVTPGSGSYLGESDSSEPNWQKSFWGSNYERLLSIKKTYDPYELFYVRQGVGSEDWTVVTATGLPTQNGKLCKVS